MAKGDKDEGLYISMNYVLQIVPLIISIIATAVYPKILKKQWGYNPEDLSTGYPPQGRAALAASFAQGVQLPAAADGAACCKAAAADGTGRPLGSVGREGSRQGLLGSWLLLGQGWSHEAQGGDAAEEGAVGVAEAGGRGCGGGQQRQRGASESGRGVEGDEPTVVVGPCLTPTRRNVTPEETPMAAPAKGGGLSEGREGSSPFSWGQGTGAAAGHSEGHQHRT